MVLRRPALPWKKYFRFGGILLVLILFVPVLGVFITKSLQLLRHQGYASTSSIMSTESTIADYCCGPEMMGMHQEEKGMMRNTTVAADRVAPMPMAAGSVNYGSAAERKIAKSASLDLRAESLVWTNGKIQEIVKNVGGYVENASISEPKAGVKTAWLSVRVPSDRLDTTLDEVKKTASAVMNESLNAGDVTDQDIDLTARLNAKLAEEAALVSLLNRAEKVSDVIEITSRLTMVRSEIERMQAEKRMLDGQVAMSSVSISIVEDPKAIADTEPVRNGNVLKQSLADLYQFGIALGSGLVMLVVSGLPVLLVYGLFFWVFYRFGRFVANRVMRKK